MHCTPLTCARRTGLQLHALFLGGTHSARASQIYMRYEALIRGPFASAEKKTEDLSLHTAHCWHI